MFLVSGCNLLGNFGHSGGFKVPYVVLALVILEGDSVLRNRAGHHHSPYAHIDSILTIWAANPSKGGTSEVEQWMGVLGEGNDQGKLSGSPRNVGQINTDSCSSAPSIIFMWSNALVFPHFYLVCHPNFVKCTVYKLADNDSPFSSVMFAWASWPQVPILSLTVCEPTEQPSLNLHRWLDKRPRVLTDRWRRPISSSANEGERDRSCARQRGV